MHSRLAFTFFVAVVVALAGCVGAGPDLSTTDDGTIVPPGDGPPGSDLDPTTTTSDDGPDTRSLHVVVDSNLTAPYEITAFVLADPVETVVVTYANGTERTYAVENGRDGLPAGALVDAVGIAPVDEAVTEISHADTSGGDGAELWIPTTGTHLAYAVTVEGQVYGWDAVDCEAMRIGDVEIAIDQQGVHTRLAVCSI